MSVYVDNMRRFAKVGWISAKWSHLMADTHEELMEFAARLGLDPAWIQHEGTHREHFDVTDAKRSEAIHLGAESITYPHGAAEVMARKRQATS